MPPDPPKPGRFAYFEWSAPDTDPDTGKPYEPGSVPDEIRDSPSIWAMANPGMNVRISEEHILAEHDGLLGRRAFDVERLGIGDWPKPEEGHAVITADQWNALVHDAVIVGQPAYAIDVSPDRAMAAMAACGDRADGRPQVEIGHHRPGTDWIVPLCERLVRRHGEIVVALDSRGPAASLILDLADAGVIVLDLSAKDVARACGQFYDAVKHEVLRHLGTRELADAIKCAVKHKLGGAWEWDRERSNGDITPLVAVTLALWASRGAGPGTAVMAFNNTELKAALDLPVDEDDELDDEIAAALSDDY